MTARAMQIEFERRLALMNPELSNSEKPDSDTIFSFLNAYTLRFVLQAFLSEDATDDNTRAQKYSKDSIRSLLTTTTLSKIAASAVDVEPCKYFFALPKDYLSYVRSSSGVNLVQDYQQGTFRRVPNELVSEEDLNKVLTSAWNQVILPHPYVSINVSGYSDQPDPRLNVIADKYTIVYNVQLTYYRKPKYFNVIGVDGDDVLAECELPDAVHMQIVEGAVEMFITENKYRLSSNSKQNKE